MCMHTHPCRHACMHECRHMLSSNRLGGTSCWKAGCEYTSWSSLTHACPIHVSMHTAARCLTRLPFWAWACVAIIYIYIYIYLYVGYVGALSDTSANICVRKRCVTCRGRSCEFDATGACIGTCTRKKLMLRHACAYMRCPGWSLGWACMMKTRMHPCMLGVLSIICCFFHPRMFFDLRLPSPGTGAQVWPAWVRLFDNQCASPLPPHAWLFQPDHADHACMLEKINLMFFMRCFIYPQAATSDPGTAWKKHPPRWRLSACMNQNCVCVTFCGCKKSKHACNDI